MSEYFMRLPWIDKEATIGSLFMYIRNNRKVYDLYLFSGLSFLTTAPVRHISLSRSVFNSSSSFSR